MSDSSNPEFGLQLDAWISKALASGADSFRDVVRYLPGVFPTVAAERVPTLADPQFAATVNRSTDLLLWPELPTPHPLDYTWWYDRGTVESLMTMVSEVTKAGDLIAMLGTPTVFLSCQRAFLDRQLLLLDRDQAAIAVAAARGLVQHRAICCDVLDDDLPPASARLIIADPPWYFGEMEQFLWAARQVARRGSILLLSCPPEGTRPNVLSERKLLFHWAGKLGFELLAVEPAALRYISPPFERNAIKASGLSVDHDWRSGDLVRLRCVRACSVSRPNALPQQKWHEETVNGVRIRIRSGSGRGAEVDTRLRQLVELDILPTVSRRAEIRSRVDVWTSGNRVFACEGRKALQIVIRAIQQRLEPVSSIEDQLGMKLTRANEEVILGTVSQLKEIVAQERLEYGRMGDSNATVD